MTDLAELKALAEAATPGPWSYDGSYVCPARVEAGTTFVETWRSVADCHQPENTQFIAAANPAVVLELIAENERLREAHEQVCTNYNQVSFASEERGKQIAELKAECEGLRKDAPSSEIIWCECGDGYPANSYGAGFMAANDGVCENCDAANACRSGEGSKTDKTPAQQGSACRSEQP